MPNKWLGLVEECHRPFCWTVQHFISWEPQKYVAQLTVLTCNVTVNCRPVQPSSDIGHFPGPEGQKPPCLTSCVVLSLASATLPPSSWPGSSFRAPGSCPLGRYTGQNRLPLAAESVVEKSYGVPDNVHIRNKIPVWFPEFAHKICASDLRHMHHLWTYASMLISHNQNTGPNPEYFEISWVTLQ
jgi:hypothetical protein